LWARAIRAEMLALASPLDDAVSIAVWSTVWIGVWILVWITLFTRWLEGMI
jgi:hypothetical protein